MGGGGREGMINFAKWRRMAAVVLECRLYQQKPYNFKEVPWIQDMLQLQPPQPQ